MMALVIISLLIIASYTVAVCIKTKGVPYSISATYYALEHKLVFGACMALTALFLFPVVWDLGISPMMGILAVAACAGLLGVGLAPDFKDAWVNKIHCGSAALTLVASQLWVGCTPFGWVLIPVWVAFAGYILYGVFRYSDFFRGRIYFIESKPMFWCEIAALATTYLAIIF